MKIIAIAAVTAGGKTTAVRAVRALLPNAAALYFDDYTFAGEVTDYAKWLAEGADVHVWDISPLKADIDAIRRSGKYDFLLLDYPFGYQHKTLRDEIDCCIFLDTPLDIALARRVLRDMQEASGAEIRTDMESYLQYAREAFVHMRQSRLADADFVIDGEKPLTAIIEAVTETVLHC
jgi:uridine kinase